MDEQVKNLASVIPEDVREVLASIVSSAQELLGPDLLSIVLFGSAAEGKLRATSDVNILLILERFDLARADSFKDPLRVGYVALKLSAMFVLRSELNAACEEFPVKFWDISRRHRVLYGQDLVSGLTIPRQAKLRALRQSLLNLSIRLRERYMATSLREEQLAIVIAEAASPLRSVASAILDLEGRVAPSPKKALKVLAKDIGGDSWEEVLESLSKARESQFLAPGISSAAIIGLMELTGKMLDYVERLK